MTPSEPERIREEARRGALTGTTAGLAPGHVQANLVAVPEEDAADFLLYCRRNPGPCPLVEVLEPGGYEPALSAPGADLRTDLPRYRVYRDGALVQERLEVRSLWRPDVVAFLLGCSFTFEGALVRAGIPLPHLEEGRSVAMYRTTLPTEPAGRFRGPLVVSMRHVPEGRVEAAVAVTARLPLAHGAPVHRGDPAAIGIRDLARPDYGEHWPAPAGTVPLFWACGVTPQAAAVDARVPLMITHAPGCMLVTDLTVEEAAAGSEEAAAGSEEAAG